MKIGAPEQDYGNFAAQFYDTGFKPQPEIENEPPPQKTQGVASNGECATCSNRRYQDSSGDPVVSFKAPTKLSPGQAASAVYAHEREHYTREAAKASEENREVVSNSIRIFTDICPECGRVYVSGGETRTVTKQKQENASFVKDFFEASVGKNVTGRNMDVSA